MADERLSLTDTAPPASFQEAVWRWGQRALWAGLAGGLALALGLAWAAPGLAPFLPLLIVGIGVGAALVRRPLANLGVVLGGFALAVNSDPGLQVTEVIYGLYLYGYLLLWYAVRLLRRERMVRSMTDRVAALFIFGFGALGTVTGVLFGADPTLLRSDLTSFFILALYFPVKEACRRDRRGPDVIVFALIGLGVFLGIQNLLTFRSILSSASQLWQVVDARFGTTEALILVAAFGALFLLLDAERWRDRVLTGGLFLFLLASLVLTKGRTFWLVFFFGVGLSFLFLRGPQRARLLFLITAGSAALLFLAVTFFGQLADLVFSGTLNRLASLEGAASGDISLIGRFVEWEALWEYIKQNPILGYGFGKTYQFFNVIVMGTINRVDSHNGYLGAWFKLGIFGLGTLLLFWVRGLYDAFRVHRDALFSTHHRTYALFALVSLAALALAANLSVFFVYMNQLFLFAALTGLASGLRQRSPAPPVS